jgi:hypothetical protein
MLEGGWLRPSGALARPRLALPTGVFSLWGLDFGKGVLENVMRIQVPRGLIPHHLSRPAGVSPPGFSPTPPAGIRTGVTASSATEGDMLGAVAVAS